MSEIMFWYVFDNSGNLIFTTDNEEKTNLDLIPTNLNPTYIKNHSLIQLLDNQEVFYDISLDAISVRTRSSMPTDTFSSTEILDGQGNLELLLELKAQVDLLTLQLEETKLELDTVKTMSQETADVVNATLLNV